MRSRVQSSLEARHLLELSGGNNVHLLSFAALWVTFCNVLASYTHLALIPASRRSSALARVDAEPPTWFVSCSSAGVCAQMASQDAKPQTLEATSPGAQLAPRRTASAARRGGSISTTTRTPPQLPVSEPPHGGRNSHCNAAPAPGAPIALPRAKPTSHINAYASASPLQRASATNIGRHQTFIGGGRAAKASRTTSSGRHAAARRRLHGIQRLVRQLRCALLAAAASDARDSKSQTARAPPPLHAHSSAHPRRHERHASRHCRAPHQRR